LGRPRVEHRRGVSASDSVVAGGRAERIVHFTTLEDFRLSRRLVGSASDENVAG
jgi:hypothetical protein